jgi:hypothetical protein
VKAGAATLVAILAVSLAVWAGFYAMTPGTPLTGGETLVVVGVCAGLVIGVRWAWNRLRGSRGTDARRV